MDLTATTVGGYLRDLPAERRVAMARVCSMIRRSARGVRESMRYGLAFYEFHGPLFALESAEKLMTLFVAEPSVIEVYKAQLPNVLLDRCAIQFHDLNRIPLDVLEKIVRDSVAARRDRLQKGKAPTQKELLALWKISEEEAKASPPIVRIPMNTADAVEGAEQTAVTEEKASSEILRAPTFNDPALVGNTPQITDPEVIKAKLAMRKRGRKSTKSKLGKTSKTTKK